ncbi:unnamed protein product [Mortierella alpina]
MFWEKERDDLLSTSAEVRRTRAQPLKLPRPFMITAECISDASHTEQAARRRKLALGLTLREKEQAWVRDKR